ncbi:hypothetical protein niasHS_010557 [Heterodera schachtii]|uniref:Uncharacterized protein n=1 Tax=Heterodera schachtii TaxID=97005 RepID=A0ABD2IZK3_HETSC
MGESPKMSSPSAAAESVANARRWEERERGNIRRGGGGAQRSDRIGWHMLAQHKDPGEMRRRALGQREAKRGESKGEKGEEGRRGKRGKEEKLLAAQQQTRKIAASAAGQQLLPPRLFPVRLPSPTAEVSFPPPAPPLRHSFVRLSVRQ